ncbi:hypothetical protein [Olivibacter sp. XZL3]|uniref:hypothetical protein n=1 Tax=Olivibacter sp. XZL3 TaxID=1735116 RepID=UPI001064E961|nr:hypothetical protein [Olivibacter sp. XZL3]
MVTQKSIFEKIGDLLQDLEEQYEFLKENPKEQGGVHLELFEANIAYLMGHVAILKKLSSLESNESNAKDTEATSETTEHEEKAADTSTKEEKPESIKEEKDDFKEEEDDQASALNYVDRQEVKETYFTPATAKEEDKAEEFKLEDKRDKKEEERREQGETGERMDYPLDDRKQEGGEAEEQQNPKNEEASKDEADEEKQEQADTSDEQVSEKRAVEEKAPVEEKPSLKEEEPMSKQIVEEAKSVVIPVEQEKVEQPKQEEPKRPMTLNELFSAQRKQEQGSFNEQKATSASSFGKPESPGGTKRITDLKSAVSLNDKLLFIKDLFNGYSLAYTEAIELLSRYDNFADADAFLQNSYAQKNNWASKQATVDKLYAILRQRFG